MEVRPQSQSDGAITRALHANRRGDPLAFDSLCQLVYAHLHRLAGHYRLRAADVLHQTTDLVHGALDAFARQRDNCFRDRQHFFAFAATAMRRVAVTWARAALRQARQEGLAEIAGPTRDAADLLALDDALQQLHALHPRCARVVELRHFAGLGVPATARELEVSERTVEGDWKLARAWLRARLS